MLSAWLREVKSDIMKIDPQVHTVAYVFPAESNVISGPLCLLPML